MLNTLSQRAVISTMFFIMGMAHLMCVNSPLLCLHPRSGYHYFCPRIPKRPQDCFPSLHLPESWSTPQPWLPYILKNLDFITRPPCFSLAVTSHHCGVKDHSSQLHLGLLHILLSVSQPLFEIFFLTIELFSLQQLKLGQLHVYEVYNLIVLTYVYAYESITVIQAGNNP